MTGVRAYQRAGTCRGSSVGKVRASGSTGWAGACGKCSTGYAGGRLPNSGHFPTYPVTSYGPKWPAGGPAGQGALDGFGVQALGQGVEDGQRLREALARLLRLTLVDVVLAVDVACLGQV
jgi:hypothetical protein